MVALGGIIGGSELLVVSAQSVINKFGLSETFFGFIVLAFLVSIEELARELPAALKGHAEISYGNVVGSILAFFLFNAGIMVLVRPVPVTPPVPWVNGSFVLGTLLLITYLMHRKKIPRWAGFLLVITYVSFSIVNYYL